MSETAHLAWVGAFVCRQGRFLVVHNVHGTSDYWSVPGGGVEAGEAMADAARREVAEETGREVRIVDLVRIVERVWPGGHYLWAFFRAEVEGGREDTSGDPTGKVQELRWVTPDEARSLIDEGREGSPTLAEMVLRGDPDLATYVARRGPEPVRTTQRGVEDVQPS